MKLHHIGYACNSIKQGLLALRQSYDLISQSEISFDHLQNAETCIVKTSGNTTMELVAGEPVKNIVKKNNVVLYHLCYETDNLASATKKFIKQGGVLITDAKPAVLFGGRKVAFIKTKQGLIELLESKTQNTDSLAENGLGEITNVSINSSFVADDIIKYTETIFSKLNVQNIKITEVNYSNLTPNSSNTQAGKNSNCQVYLLRIIDWYQFPKLNAKKLERSIEHGENNLFKHLEKLSEHGKHDVLIFICPSNLAGKWEKHSKLITEVEKKICKRINKATKARCFIYPEYEKDFLWKDEKKYSSAYIESNSLIPYSKHYFSLLGLVVAKQLIKCVSQLIKVVVVDCDDTLWRGVCAEARSPNDIVVSSDHQKFHTYLNTLANNGYLICLCSKNNESDVLNLINTHDKIKLKIDKLAAWKINWKSKVDNLLELSSELNIPLESFIFIDDNPIECNNISNTFPQVLVACFPKSPKNIPLLANSLWVADIKKTKTSEIRQNHYKHELLRKNAEAKATSQKKFLDSLKLEMIVIDVTKNKKDNIARAAEMSVRVTQFNLAGNHYTEEELVELINKGYRIIQIHLKDIYGDYGLIATAILHVEKKTLVVSDLYISCRAFYRGVEHHLLQQIATIANSKKIDFILLNYLATQRNIPVNNFLSNLTLRKTSEQENGIVTYKLNTQDAIDIKYQPVGSITQAAGNLKTVSNHSNYINSAILEKIFKFFSSFERFTTYIQEHGFPNLQDSFTQKRITDNDDILSFIGEIWRSILMLDYKPTLENNFMHDGGTSLQAVELLSAIYEHTGAEVSLYSFLQEPTFAALLNKCAIKNSSNENQTHLQQSSATNILPSSENQQWLWLNKKIDGFSWHYNIPFVFAINGSLDLQALQTSLAQMVSKHPAFRTTFVDNRDCAKLQQKIHPKAIPKLEILEVDDFSDLQLNDLISKKCKIEFDFCSSPPYQLTLLRSSNEKWILIATIHHIIFDAESAKIFIRELSSLYNNNRKKNNSTETQQLPALRKNILSTEKYNAGVQYWSDELGKVRPLILPYDHTLSKVNRHAGKCLQFELSKEIKEKLLDLTKKHSVSLQTFVLSALHILLRGYGNQETIIPISIAGRSQQNKENIGFFSNVLPIKLDSSKISAFPEFLCYVDEKVRRAYKHADLPLYNLVPKLSIDRFGTHNPFTQLLLSVFDEQYMQPLSFDSIENTYYQYGYDAARMDITIEILQSVADKTVLLIYYNTELFLEPTITSFGNKLTAILGHIAIKDSLPKAATSDNEASLYGQLMARKQLNLGSYFDHSVIAKPSAVALTCGKEKITYGKLSELADVITATIPNHNLAIIHLPRSIELVATYLAMLRKGITFIPVDHNSPLGWLKEIIEIAKPSTLITNSALIDKVDELKNRVKIINIDSVAKDSDSNEFKQPQDLAYILFTSGSTGTPKGVKISHANITNLVSWAIGHYSPAELADVLFSTSVSFDLSMFELFATLAAGGTAHIADNALLLIDNNSLKLSLINTTPTVLNSILEHGTIPASTKVINLAGEPLSQQLINKIWKLTAVEKIYNLYAPTETTTYSTCKLHQRADKEELTVGMPIDNTSIHILDEKRQVVSSGEIGEIAIGGSGVAAGYLQKKMNKDKFVKNSYSNKYSTQLYLTGDYGYINSANELVFCGRRDTQIKNRGQRVELSHIESCLAALTEISTAALMIREGETPEQATLAAYLVPTKWPNNINEFLFKIKAKLQYKLPAYMIPTHYKLLKNMPKLASGKIDRKAFLAMQPQTLSHKTIAQHSDQITQRLLIAWRETLEHSNFSADDNFFDVGGNSLLIVKLYESIRNNTTEEYQFNIADLFSYPTIATFKEFLTSPLEKPSAVRIAAPTEEIAIVGVSCRFPQANNLDEYWDIVSNGKTVVHHFSTEELAKFNIDLSSMSNNYVPCSGHLADAYSFDNKFFGYSPADAEQIDPQQRIFLELAWEALEDAGSIPNKTAENVGVFAGMGLSFHNRSQISSTNDYVRNWHSSYEDNKLAMRIAHKLDLHGPAININTACSTALTAISTAAQYLRSGTIDAALVGTVSILPEHKIGYVYSRDHIYAKNGVCRPFDDKATGTVPSSGAGVVILKRLGQALADGDNIYAVIKDVGINNDGKVKQSFAAPSAKFQTKCLTQALETSGVDSSQISYIETHGTGTNIGDPIELQGIVSAYQNAKHCTLGAVKANIGHTDIASGMAGLLKVIAMLKHRQLPPQINFTELNHKTALDSDKFTINTKLQPWKNPNGLLASVSSFGLGGTNTHLILQEAPTTVEKNTAVITQPAEIFLSAKTANALKQARNDLAEHLQQPEGNKKNLSFLHDVAYTLINHRAEFSHYYYCSCQSYEELITKLLSEPSNDNNLPDLKALKQKYLLGTRKRVALPGYDFDKYTFNKIKDAEVTIKSFAPSTNEKKITTYGIEALHTIWSELLGLETITNDDDFFTLGGDSLLLLSLNARIDETWGIDLTLDQLTEHPTPIEMFKLIQKGLMKIDLSSVQLKQLKKANKEHVVLLIHPGNGTLFHYYPLVEQTNNDSSIYGISNTSLKTNNQGFNSIEAYAERYLELIRTELATAKVTLLGWSFGGSIAYEMARRPTNDSIEKVILLDSWVQYPDSFGAESILKRVAEEVDATSTNHSQLFEVIKQRMLLLKQYTPSKLSTIPVTLFKAMGDSELAKNKSNGWDKYIKKLQVLPLTGTHDDVLSGDNLDVIVNYLNRLTQASDTRKTDGE